MRVKTPSVVDEYNTEELSPIITEDVEEKSELDFGVARDTYLEGLKDDSDFQKYFVVGFIKEILNDNREIMNVNTANDERKIVIELIVRQELVSKLSSILDRISK